MLVKQFFIARQIPIWTFLLVASKLFGSSIGAYILALPSFFANINNSCTVVKLLLVFASLPFLPSVFLLNATGLANVLSSILFYFSFLYLVVVMGSWSRFAVRQLLEFLFRFSFAFNILEFFFLNTPLNKFVYYFPEDHVHRALILGFQKALGLSSISSVSGFAAVFIYILLKEFFGVRGKIYTFLTILSLLFLMSGTGFFFFIAYSSYYSVRSLGLFSLLKSNSSFTINTSFFYSFAILIFTLIVASNSAINKFTFTYFEEIFLLKINQFSMFVLADNDWFTNLLGASFSTGEAITSGDFGFLAISQSFGFYGILLYCVTPVLLFKKKRILLSLAVVLSLYHYPAFGGAFGSLLYGVAVCLSRLDENQSAVNVATV